MSVKEVAMGYNATGTPILLRLLLLSGEEGSGGDEESASEDEVRCSY